MKTILVVDDDDGIRTMISTVFKREGYGILETDNGADAVDIVNEQHPDLIICDVMMENMNGFMVREMLKDNPETAKIPMIMMTGMATSAGAWEADKEVEYLKKPFLIPDLRLLIEKRIGTPA
ncbi:MAG: response regulator [Bacteroidota bacterium]